MRHRTHLPSWRRTAPQRLRRGGAFSCLEPRVGGNGRPAGDRTRVVLEWAALLEQSGFGAIQLVAAATTGSWIFAADHSYSAEGTVTFPGEPTDAIAVSGRWIQAGCTVTLTDDSGSTPWTIRADGAELILTQQEDPPANTVTLRRA